MEMGPEVMVSLTLGSISGCNESNLFTRSNRKILTVTIWLLITYSNYNPTRIVLQAMVVINCSVNHNDCVTDSVVAKHTCGTLPLGFGTD